MRILEARTKEIESLEAESKKTITVAKCKRTKEINILEKTRKSIEHADKLSNEEKQENQPRYQHQSSLLYHLSAFYKEVFWL